MQAMDGQREREGGSKVQTARTRSNCETCILPAAGVKSTVSTDIDDLDHLSAMILIRLIS